MTTEELLTELRDRSLVVVLVGDRLSLRGDRVQVTPSLTDVLRWHRTQLVALLQEQREREWQWRDGTQYRARSLPTTWHPQGAIWWRYTDSDFWNATPEAQEARLNGATK